MQKASYATAVARRRSIAQEVIVTRVVGRKEIAAKRIRCDGAHGGEACMSVDAGD